MVDTFEVRSEPVDVTSMNRPDTAWRFTDAAGHEHAWYVDGQPATSYSPNHRHELPTLRWVVTVEATDDDFEIGHYECRQCGEQVQPGRTADVNRQYIAGVRECFINGQRVNPEEFERRWRQAHPDAR